MIFLKKYAFLFLTFLIIIILVPTTVIAINLSLSQTLIYLDPGHGGFDGGAVGDGAIYEKHIVLSITLKLKLYLEKTGYKVLLTRSTDTSLPGEGKSSKQADIYKRVELINKSNAYMFVSIHANSFPSSIVSGAQTFYNPNILGNEELAIEIQTMIKNFHPNNHRLAKKIKGKYLIDEVFVLGCLVEVGFLSNPSELILLQKESYQAEMALAIYLGIISYIEKHGEI